MLTDGRVDLNADVSLNAMFDAVAVSEVNLCVAVSVVEASVPVKLDVEN